MACGSSKYPFFQKLREVAVTVSNDVSEIETKRQSSKLELPENNALFKLIQLCDDVKAYKSDAQAFHQQLCGENQKYMCYRKDIELLVDEMETNIDKVEDLLIGYGYQKWHPEHEDDCLISSNSSNATPLKGKLPVVSVAAEEEQRLTLQRTPDLADYGLTAKLATKSLRSALKDKQESVVKSSKKQVHFESPQGLSDLKEKENRVPYSIKKTPLLEDYGLPSRKKRNLQIPDAKDPCIKKQLSFQSPVSSVSKNVTVLLPSADIDDTDEFQKLINSLNSGEKIENGGFPEAQNDVKLSTPEEPFLSCSQKIRFLSKRKNETVTPEEPEIQPIRKQGVSNITDDEPSTPKTPELEVTSSFKNWLRSQKKK